MAMIQENILRLKDDISLICHKLGRNPQEVTIVAVTKYASLSMMEEALKGGMLHVGENKVQEAAQKYVKVKSGIVKHMIGHLQTNKVKEAVKIFDVIDSVDSVRLASVIQKEAAKLNKKVDILIQANTAKEPQKYGLTEEEVIPATREISQFSHIRVLGLMTVAPLTENHDLVRNCFRKLRKLYETIAKEFMGYPRVPMKFLSMGMSSDYRIALEEGANMLRIGSAIFK